MENASKALIIAGAILLSILIIALGMNVYNSASSSAANADLSGQEISSFNSTFESYEGRQKGTAVRQLVTAVKASNAKNEDRKININGADAASYDIGALVSNKSYTVKLLYNNDASNLAQNGGNDVVGLIANIEIN